MGLSHGLICYKMAYKVNTCRGVQGSALGNAGAAKRLVIQNGLFYLREIAWEMWFYLDWKSIFLNGWTHYKIMQVA